MSTEIGREAESAACEYLKSRGIKIIDQNWRTRQCEIDIVAESTEKSSLLKHNTIIHFVEVKYRKSISQGDGLDYITPQKLKQMIFAAQYWVHEKEWSGDYQIDAISVTGYAGSWDFDYRPNISS